MTQQDNIYKMLENKDWRCGSEFLQAYLPEYRSIINKLRKSGHTIIKRRCENPYHHHKGGMLEWKLCQTQETAPRTIKSATYTMAKREFCCLGKWNSGEHNEKCHKLKTRTKIIEQPLRDLFYAKDK